MVLNDSGADCRSLVRPPTGDEVPDRDVVELMLLVPGVPSISHAPFRAGLSGEQGKISSRAGRGRPPVQLVVQPGPGVSPVLVRG
jgi:hypothetical protein